MAKIERTKNASRNIFFGVILKAYQILVPFLMRTAMIYLMGVQYLGLNSLFISILSVLNLAELGVGSAMVYSMYKPIAEDDHTVICALIRLYRTYYRVIGALIAVVGVAITPFIPKLISGDVPAGINIYILYLLNLGATVLSYWLFAYKNSILQAHQRTDVVSKVTLFTSTIQYGLQIFVLWAFKNYYYFVIVMLATQALTNVLTAMYADKIYPMFKPEGDIDVEEKKIINGRIKDLFTSRLGTVFGTSVDSVVISACLGLTVLAIYQNYLYIMNAVIGILQVVFTSITAGIGNSLVVETGEKNYRDFEKLTFFIIWICTVCISCFACLYQPFMRTWVGNELLLPEPMVVLFCLYFYLYIMQGLCCVYKDAAGIWRQDRFRPLIAGVFNLIMNVSFVRFIGIYAIVLSTIVSYLLVAMPWVIYNLFKIVFKKNPWQYAFQLIKGLSISFLIGLISYILCCFIIFPGIIGIVSRGLVALVSSNIMLIVIFRKNQLYFEMINMIDNMTKKKFSKFLNLIGGSKL